MAAWSIDGKLFYSGDRTSPTTPSVSDSSELGPNPNVYPDPVEDGLSAAFEQAMALDEGGKPLLDVQATIDLLRNAFSSLGTVSLAQLNKLTSMVTDECDKSWNETGDVFALDNAIRLLELFLEHCPRQDHLMRTSYLERLCLNFRNRLEKLWDRDCSDKAIHYYRELCQAYPEEDPDRARAMINTSLFMVQQVQETQDVLVLLEAVETVNAAIKMLPEANPHHAPAASILASAHDARFRLTRDGASRRPTRIQNSSRETSPRPSWLSLRLKPTS